MLGIKGTLKTTFNKLDSTNKSSLMLRCEQFAAWTLPSIFPPTETSESDEFQQDMQSVGARATNHLSNKLTLALFAPSRSFFRLDVAPKFMQKLEQSGLGQPQVQLALSRAEQQAMKDFTKWGARTAMTTAMKHLIITGNCLAYFPDNGKVQIYSLRDYVVRRDLSGNVLEIICKDAKAFVALPKNLQDAIKTGEPNIKDDDKVELYTQILLKDDGKYYVSQDVNDVPVPDVTGIYPKTKLPWIPLTWNLIRGHDYGIGLVEDYAGDFHALSTLSEAMVKGAAIAADIKFLVDPTGTTDYRMLNSAPIGAYVPGRADDITAMQVNKANDWNVVLQIMQSYEKRIGMAFLLGSSVTRDAERVTAEEIRHQANELETSLGGVYSRLAEDLQLPIAFILIARGDLNLGTDNEIEPTIVTGMDSLSRNGDLENLQLFFMDLGMIAQLPQMVQMYIKVPQIMTMIGAARGVKYEEFMKDEQTVQQEMKQQRQQQMQMQEQQEAAKALPKVIGE